MKPETDPTELRNLRRIGGVAVVLLALALGWLALRRETANTVVFPDGTRVTAYRVTWGAAMERPPWAADLRRRMGRWLAGPWSPALHPAILLPEVTGGRWFNSDPVMSVRTGLGSRFVPTFDTVLEPGHLELLVVPGTNAAPFWVAVLDGSGAPLEEGLVSPSLPVALHREPLRWADWRSERLRFRIRRGDVERFVELPNPRPPSTWRNFRGPSETLPAVRNSHGLEMRLLGLRAAEAGDGQAVSWVPELRFVRGDRDVTAGMDYQYRFEDADGRIHSLRLPPSEPRWRIHVQAWPTSSWEAEDGDEIGLRLPHVPADGEWIPLPDPEALRPLGIVGGGFSGPGSVSVANGVPVGPDPAAPSGRGTAPPIEVTRESWSVRTRVDQTVLWLVLDADGVAQPFWEDAAGDTDGWAVAYRAIGEPWRTSRAAVVGFDVDRTRRLVRIDLDGERPGPVRLQVRRRFHDTFLIDAPKAPAPAGPTPTTPR